MLGFLCCVLNTHLLFLAAAIQRTRMYTLRTSIDAIINISLNVNIRVYSSKYSIKIKCNKDSILHVLLMLIEHLAALFKPILCNANVMLEIGFYYFFIYITVSIQSIQFGCSFV